MSWKKEKVQVYQTVLIIVVALLLAYWYWEKDKLLYSAIGLGGLSLVFYSFAKFVYRAWMGLANVLSWVNTRILLGLVFFVLLTPLALWRRMIGKQGFPMKGDDRLDSYFQERTSEINATDFEKPW